MDFCLLISGEYTEIHDDTKKNSGSFRIYFREISSGKMKLDRKTIV